MTATPTSTSPDVPSVVADDSAHRSRWAILAVLCISVFVVVLDSTIVNVALPTLVTELGASNSELQWIVDSYVLVFAGLLIAAGSLGDRFGRKGMLQLGLVLFGAFSGLAALSGSAGELIGWRAAMGLGAALLFPATLAILVNVFTDARERATAIAVWAATAGVAVALGPVTGGYLLEHFWWGSVLMINVPIVALAVVAVGRIVPTSRDTTIHRFDPLGTLLSIAGIGVLVWAVIEGPQHGWWSPASIAAFALATALLAGFVGWERRIDHPMLDVRVFSNLRFTAGSLSITFAFFALFGFVFVVTQYFQFVREYGTFEAGLRTVPFAVFVGVMAPVSQKLAARVGTKAVVTVGLVSMAIGFAVAAMTAAVDTPYIVIVLAMLFMGGGLGLVQAPATEAIMGSLPPAKAGVGSAVNDTARELGGTLGVAIIGSVFSSIYAARLGDALTGTPVPPEALDAAEQSVGAARVVAEQAGATAGPDAQRFVTDAINTAFLDGWRVGSWVSVGLVLVGALLAWRFLPARAATTTAAEAIEDDADDAALHPVAVGAEPELV